MKLHAGCRLPRRPCGRRPRLRGALLPWGVGRLLLVTSLVVSAAAVAADESPAEVVIGEVVRVVDGDTLVLRSRGTETRVRLAQIDAPEIAQPYGEAARDALRSLASGRPARLVVIDVDRYGRKVGELHAGGLHVNPEMVRRGHAWAYTTYVTSLEILDLEQEARRAKRGLWALPSEERIPPWQWRHGPERHAPAATATLRCGAKRRCSEMSSCAEARFHLESCGLTRLDGDGDGIPCEQLCR